VIEFVERGSTAGLMSFIFIIVCPLSDATLDGRKLPPKTTAIVAVVLKKPEREAKNSVMSDPNLAEGFVEEADGFVDVGL
jgi:hypothetical protein